MKKMIPLFVVMLGLSAPVLAENQLHYNILEFNESATVKVPNDTLNIILVIEETNKNRQAASNAVTKKLNAVQAKIKQNKAVTFELGSRHAYPQYDDKGKITGWQDSVMIHLKSQEFDILSNLVAEVQGQAMVRHLNFSLSPDKRVKAIEQASEQALKALQQRAQFLSRQLGFSRYQLVKVDLTDSFESSNQGMAEYAVAAAPQMAMRKSADNMEINPDSAGEQEIRQTVRVSLQMQN